LLTSNQVAAATGGLGYAIPCSVGCLSSVVSDNTVFAVGAKYTLGPWKFYGGYEHIQFANPSTPLLPGAFAQGGYNVAFLNNNRYFDNRNQDVFWVGVKYAVTPTFDVIGAYYGARQHYFNVGAAPAAGTFFNLPGVAGLAAAPAGFASQAAACAANGALSPGCAGTIDMFSMAIDWRFARHVDMYAGVAYSTKSGGLANGFVLSTGNGTLTGAAVNNRVSVWDPGIGLRYQF
jgi:predicted porin